MKVFILLSFVAVALASRECGKNSHYNSCGTACPLTCDNYENPPKACVLMCNPGCHCDAGYVKNAQGECVKPEECPVKSETVCGVNERFLECGTACPLTCDNYAYPPKFCVLRCVSGCHCEAGYVETHDGRCVRPEDCPAKTPSLESCLAKHKTGMCKAYIPMWYYDVTTGKCHEFIYGGCGGNGNKYVTEEECLKRCGDVKLKQSSDSTCDQPAETGLCRGFFPRFYFDKTSGQCKKFIYGGCGGNDNNFSTEEECKQACDVQATEDICSLPSETGLCRAYFPRYFFNQKSGKCEKFIYGGCGGNGNNFRSVEECQKTCA